MKELQSVKCRIKNGCLIPIQRIAFKPNQEIGSKKETPCENLGFFYAMKFFIFVYIKKINESVYKIIICYRCNCFSWQMR